MDEGLAVMVAQAPLQQAQASRIVSHKIVLTQGKSELCVESQGQCESTLPPVFPLEGSEEP